jgi:hypothetical protein
MKRILILILAVVGTSSATAQEAGPPPQFALDQLAFVAGCWEGPFVRDSLEGTMEEHYTTPSENFILGTTRYIINGITVEYELAVIRRDPSGRVALIPYPGGAIGTPFLLSAVADQTAIFENPGNEFPKRIIYRLTRDDRLHARIDAGVGTDGAEWLLSRAECFTGGE